MRHGGLDELFYRESTRVETRLSAAPVSRAAKIGYIDPIEPPGPRLHSPGSVSAARMVG
jgi:hypothetical protein